MFFRPTKPTNLQTNKNLQKPTKIYKNLHNFRVRQFYKVLVFK
jgi:hypothetical protein